VKLTPGRWELTTGPIIVDGRKLCFRGTLRDTVKDTTNHWTASYRDGVRTTARDAALETERAERHQAEAVLVEVLA
jgi:hypothetical protein